MQDALLKNKIFNLEKSLSFGFEKTDGGYLYVRNIAEGQFQMRVIISEMGEISARVMDSISMDEYVLHRTEGACGAFVGMVRTDYENVLNEVADKCFDVNVFKSEYAKKIIEYAHSAYDDELEFLWERFAGNAVLRRKDTGKWYGALLKVSGRKLGIDSDEIIEILDLRIKSEDVDALIDGARYFLGYHMNKKHWYTICLDGSVSIEEIYKRIDESFLLAKK